ncbi:putative uncharacterized protein [Prevotella sp. CAG:617]|nr:putative uncharacterized protein [Prevotella sp. CAG:617]
MRKFGLLHRKRIWIVFLLVIVLIILLWLFLPVSRDVRRRSIVWVECRSCYFLASPGIDTLYFNYYDTSDSSFLGMALDACSLEEITRASGFWYQPFWWLNDGRLFTSGNIVPNDSLLKVFKKSPMAFMERQLEQCRKQVLRIQHEENEYQYYMRTHSVQDEGYTLVAQHYSKLKLYHDTLIRLSNKLEMYKRLSSSALQLQRMSHYQVRSVSEKGLDSSFVECSLLKHDVAYNVALLQTVDGTLPGGASVVTGRPFDVLRMFFNYRPNRSAELVGFNRPADFALADSVEPDFIPGKLMINGKNTTQSFPVLSGIDGAPIFLSNGHLWGILADGKCVHYSYLNKLW